MIHNKLVYKSANKDDKAKTNFKEPVQMGRSRYQFHHSGKKIQKDIEKVVTDFL